jgi:hypothetical protein
MGSSRTSFKFIEDLDLPLTMSPQLVLKPCAAAWAFAGVAAPCFKAQIPFALVMARKLKWVH